ncbi:MAG: DoxX family protein [Isosphaeraceae bacterium]|nr:DoxX family protein [Isosphaeraceae bacterium]
MKKARIAGVVLHVLVGGMMIFAGSGKALGFAPAEIVEKLREFGLGERVALIGWGELITAILLLVPWTSSLGTLATSGFWGGVIAIHMAKDGEIAMGSVFLLLTWIGALLRTPSMFASFRPSPSKEVSSEGAAG